MTKERRKVQDCQQSNKYLEPLEGAVPKAIRVKLHARSSHMGAG